MDRSAAGGRVRGWAYRNLLDQLSAALRGRALRSGHGPRGRTAPRGIGPGRCWRGGAVQIATTALPAGRATLGLTAKRSAWRAGAGRGGDRDRAWRGWRRRRRGRGRGRWRRRRRRERRWSSGRPPWTGTFGSTASRWNTRCGRCRRVGLAAGGMYHRLDGSEIDDGAAGASLGAYVDAGHAVRLRATYARRFRFPTLRQLYEISAGEPGAGYGRGRSVRGGRGVRARCPAPRSA